LLKISAICSLSLVLAYVYHVCVDALLPSRWPTFA